MSDERSEVTQGLTHSTTEPFRQRNANALFCQPSSKEELIAEIQRKVAYLVATDDYTAEEKEAIARRFFQALEED
jgi:hypothetical protein